MISDRFGHRHYYRGCYDLIFEAIPRGRDSALFPWQLSSILSYDYGICLYEEALRVIRCMQADGYIIIENNGRFYRAESIEELASVYGSTIAREAEYSFFWKI